MKRGFTLVELAIVLVIIGLLIGGILVAQSMMDTATITNQVRQFQQFDIAVSNFKTLYNAVPGDTSKISPKSASANDDGIIDENTLYLNTEITYFCAQLAAVGMLGPGVSYNSGGCNPCTLSAPGFFPLAKLPPFKRNSSDLAGSPDGALGVMAFGVAGNKNYYLIVNQGKANNELAGALAVAPGYLAALDSKMDDGNGATGKVFAKQWNSGFTNDTEASWGSNLCVNNSGKYYVNRSTGTSIHYGCSPLIEMLSTGETQP